MKSVKLDCMIKVDRVSIDTTQLSYAEVRGSLHPMNVELPPGRAPEIVFNCPVSPSMSNILVNMFGGIMTEHLEGKHGLSRKDKADMQRGRDVMRGFAGPRRGGDE